MKQLLIHTGSEEKQRGKENQLHVVTMVTTHLCLSLPDSTPNKAGRNAERKLHLKLPAGFYQVKIRDERWRFGYVTFDLWGTSVLQQRHSGWKEADKRSDEEEEINTTLKFRLPGALLNPNRTLGLASE